MAGIDVQANPHSPMHSFILRAFKRHIPGITTFKRLFYRVLAFKEHAYGMLAFKGHAYGMLAFKRHAYKLHTVRVHAPRMLSIGAAFALSTAAPVFAQEEGPQNADSRAPVSATCAHQLISYLDWPSVENPSWKFVHESDSAGAMYYFGSVHSDDPSHPQFDAIEAAYQAFDPTVVFYEGPKRPIGESREATIKNFGESGFVRYLATRDDVEIRRLEPNPVDEMNEVLKSYSSEQAGLFFLLREASRLRERKDMDQDQIAETIAGIIGQARQMMPEFPFETIDDLQRSYATFWSEPPLWWQAPADWFDPTSDSGGGRFTYGINRVSSEYRNRHMYEVLALAVLDGERVFAVVGRNHVPMQAQALACALK